MQLNLVTAKQFDQILTYLDKDPQWKTYEMVKEDLFSELSYQAFTRLLETLSSVIQQRQIDVIELRDDATFLKATEQTTAFLLGGGFPGLLASEAQKAKEKERYDSNQKQKAALDLISAKRNNKLFWLIFFLFRCQLCINPYFVCA